MVILDKYEYKNSVNSYNLYVNNINLETEILKIIMSYLT